MQWPTMRRQKTGTEFEIPFDTMPIFQLRHIANGLASDGTVRRLPPREFEGEVRAIAARVLLERS